MKKKIIIIDYHLGNLFSVKNVFEKLNLNISISSNLNDIDNADAIILPGVGAFKEAMTNLETYNLIEPIKKFIKSGKPFMGVCLGLQLLFDESEEFENCKGLGIIEGKVTKLKFSTENKIKIPHIGWNSIFYKKNAFWDSTPLQDIKNGTDMYFVHSYYINPLDQNVILSYTNYEGLNFASSILKNNIFACQFHPEKSGKIGLEIYSNWVKINNLN
jgi:glutamine amidotransferase